MFDWFAFIIGKLIYKTNYFGHSFKEKRDCLQININCFDEWILRSVIHSKTYYILLFDRISTNKKTRLIFPEILLSNMSTWCDWVLIVKSKKIYLITIIQLFIIFIGHNSKLYRLARQHILSVLVADLSYTGTNLKHVDWVAHFKWCNTNLVVRRRM